MLDWLIVGGGVHGTVLAHHLARRGPAGGITTGRALVLDPHAAPLARWDACARATGMTHLRSPAAHHFDADPGALRRWAHAAGAADAAGPARRGRRGGYRPGAAGEGAWAGAHGRPALAVFRAHADHVIARDGLAGARRRARATALVRLASPARGWRVETDAGGLEARTVVLAPGAGEQPRWPPWAAALRAVGAPVTHVFDPAFNRAALPTSVRRVAVVGGGISAAQLALALAGDGRAVTLVARHGARVHRFDSDPCWMDGRCLGRFAREPSPAARRAAIAAARRPGSLPPEVDGALRQAVRAGRLTSLIAGVVDAHAGGLSGSAVLCVTLPAPEDAATEASADAVHGAERHGPFDLVVLATGFEPRRPGGAWLDAAVGEYELPVAPCGYPIPTRSLRWAPGLAVMGPLAELEVGPPARNIIGAHLAARRLLTG